MVRESIIVELLWLVGLTNPNPNPNPTLLLYNLWLDYVNFPSKARKTRAWLLSDLENVTGFKRGS